MGELISSAVLVKGGGRPVRLRLNSLPAARGSFSRLLRLRAAGRLDSSTFRDLCFGMSTLLSFWKLEADIALQEKMDALEKRLEGMA